MAREKLCIGIDIGASAVKVCQLRVLKKAVSVVNFGVEQLPPETVVDGALMSSARVVEAIRNLLSGIKGKNKFAAISVSGHSVIIKKIQLPQMSRDELDQSIQWEAEQFIPFDMADVFIDAQIVREASENQGQMDVVLVAAKKDFVNEYTSVVVEAGLEPVVCDVDAFAVETCFEANYERDEDNTVVLVNVGAAKTNINILSAGVSSFTRDLGVAGNNITEEIQKQLGISFEEAEAKKVSGDLSGAVDRAVRSVVDGITNEIHRSIDFYAATSAAAPPSLVYLSGGSANLGILAQNIKDKIHVDTTPMDPFRQIDTSAADADLLKSVGPAAAVCVGLGLRAPGDSA